MSTAEPSDEPEIELATSRDDHWLNLAALTPEQRLLAVDVVETALDVLRTEDAAARARAALKVAIDAHRMAKIQHKAATLAARAGGVEGIED